MVLSPENNWEKILSHLPAYQIYKKFNETSTDSKSDYCKSLEKYKPDDITLCNKIVNTLTQLKDKNNGKQKLGCYFFQHWLNDQISEKYYNRTYTGKENDIANEILNVVSTFISNYNMSDACRGGFWVDPVGWKKDKDLHDYFENFDKIKCDNVDKTMCQHYVNYVTYIDPFYKKKIDDCCEEDELMEYYCSTFVRCESKYNTQKLLTQLRESLELLNTKGEESHETSTLQPETPSAYSIEKIGDDNDEGSFNTSDTRRDTEPEIITETQDIIETVHNKVGFNLLNNFIVTTSILGAILFLFYYHRSTRLGPDYNKRKRKKKKIKNNYYDESEENLSMYSSEYILEDPQTRRLNLIYHAA
ncbi:variable surface protein [Plasmodium gonderi]|uniref:Variable surface protein n=1 Tax=Plasmodium gonderi TaxID=77519 RepID=A0A1Y1JDU4_PLAGO|nr:variable surface protein [Plasmodium gonderi]GAW79858.1 variable surface protein [Plasmodium gonderi]